MAVQLGSRGQADFSEPIELMVDCHRRIEQFLRVLERVAETCAGELSGEERRALESALRYFREAAPHHTADEEESLLPRLRTLERPDLEELLVKADRIEEEHRRAEALHERVDACGRIWLERGAIGDATRAQMQRDLKALRKLYTGHIAFEEEQLFPAAAEVLDSVELAGVGREMAARRGVMRE